MSSFATSAQPQKDLKITFSRDNTGLEIILEKLGTWYIYYVPESTVLFSAIIHSQNRFVTGQKLKCNVANSQQSDGDGSIELTLISTNRPYPSQNRIWKERKKKRNVNALICTMAVCHVFQTVGWLMQTAQSFEHVCVPIRM